MENNKKDLIISYNSVRGMAASMEAQMRERCIVIDNAFAKPKSRAAIQDGDPRVAEILAAAHDARRIFIFLGKVDSGALAIAEFCATRLAEHAARMHFVLCPHELEEKRSVLAALGFSDAPQSVFEDTAYRIGAQCNEWPYLFGLAAME
mgnify:CR=1 FL=1